MDPITQDPKQAEKEPVEGPVSVDAGDDDLPADAEVKIKFPGDDDEPASHQPEEPQDDSRLAELRERLETAEKRLNDTQKSWQDQHGQLLDFQKQTEQYRQEMDRRSRAAEDAKQYEVPEITPDDLADPEAGAKKLAQAIQTLERRQQAMMHPWQEQVGSALNNLQALSSMTAEIAMERAEKEIEAMGLDVSDFNKVKKDIKERFEGIGPNGISLMLEPGRVRQAYLMMKGEEVKPLPIKAQPTSAPVVTKPRASASDNSELEDRKRRVVDYYGEDAMREYFGKFDLGNVELSEDELKFLEDEMGRRNDR